MADKEEIKQNNEKELSRLPKWANSYLFTTHVGGGYKDGIAWKTSKTYRNLQKFALLAVLTGVALKALHYDLASATLFFIAMVLFFITMTIQNKIIKTAPTKIVKDSVDQVVYIDKRFNPNVTSNITWKVALVIILAVVAFISLSFAMGGHK